MSRRIIPTISEKGWGFPGTGPQPTVWSSDTWPQNIMASSGFLNSLSSLILWTTWEAQWHVYQDCVRWESRKQYPSESSESSHETLSFPEHCSTHIQPPFQPHIKHFSTDTSPVFPPKHSPIFFPTLPHIFFVPPLKHFPQSTYITTLFVLQLLRRQKWWRSSLLFFQASGTVQGYGKDSLADDGEMNKLPQGAALFCSMLAHLYPGNDKFNCSSSAFK